MAKPKIPNFRKSTLQHKQRIEQYCALIQQIYDNVTNKGAQLALLTNHEAGKPFSFDDYPMAKEAFSKLLERMKTDLTVTVMAGTSNEWKQSNMVQDLVANKVLKAYTGKSDNGEFKRYFQTNPDALKAFQQRKIAGMNLSDRVWNLTEQYKPELEMAITSAIAPGMSAQNLSVEIKQYLNEPDLMFRRFRYKDEDGRWKRKWKRKIKDEEGNVRFIDCDKNTYKSDWTGPGYYKSSSKNAKRLARTEINMAYRTAEQERWKQFDFVVGYEVHTTQNGTHDFGEKNEEDYKYRPARLANLSKIHKPDICDQLAGKYPKDFHFTGWHPQCLCYAIPILKTEDEFWNYDEDDPEESVNTVTDVPEQFKEWVQENQKRIKGAEERGTLPYFLSDNRNYMEEAFIETNLTKEQKDYIKKWPNRKSDCLKVFNNSEYNDVMFNLENGGLKAVHKDHNFDKDKGQYEKDVIDIGFQNGHSVILESEYSNELYKRFTEGSWDGMQFELASRETATDNNILRGLLHCADKRTTEIAILYFPNGGFSIEKIERAKRRYYGYSKVGKNIINFKRLLGITEKGIVYDQPL